MIDVAVLLTAHLLAELIHKSPEHDAMLAATDSRT